MNKLLSFINKPWWSFVGCVLAIFAFFGISSGNLVEAFGKYQWIISASKWSLIIGAFLFAIHAYIRAEKNRKNLIQIKSSTYDEVYKKFSDAINYAVGRYKGYKENLDPDNRKYTVVGVLEMINEVKTARLRLLSMCGDNLRSILLKEGTDWLDDVEKFGTTAPNIIQKLAENVHKDRR
jgi:hypothetical protein